MKKGLVVAIIIYVAMILCVPLLAVVVASATRDVSWIGPVEGFIKKDNWVPNSTYEPIADDSFFLNEKGVEQYFFLYNQREFVSYIDGLMDRVDRQVNSSIPRQLLDGILAVDKVLVLVHRWPEKFGLFGKYGSSEVAYFILEDNSGKDLGGAIIMQDRRAGEFSHYSVWQITDWSPW